MEENININSNCLFLFGRWWIRPSITIHNPSIQAQAVTLRLGQGVDRNGSLSSESASSNWYEHQQLLNNRCQICVVNLISDQKFTASLQFLLRFDSAQVSFQLTDANYNGPNAIRHEPKPLYKKRTNRPTKAAVAWDPFQDQPTILVNNKYIYTISRDWHKMHYPKIHRLYQFRYACTHARKTKAVWDKVSDTTPRHPSSNHWLELRVPLHSRNDEVANFQTSFHPNLAIKMWRRKAFWNGLVIEKTLMRNGFA